MYGGGGKWGAIILGVALIAAAFALPVLAPGATGLFFAGTSIGMTTGMMFTMGAGMLLLGVSQLFMKAPTVDKSSDPPPSKYLGNSKNTSAIGTLITMAYGRIKLTGHWLSIQVDSNDLVTTSFPATTS
jgi:predicted phage tail protein